MEQILKTMLETSCQHFLHAAIIILSFHCPDPELAIGIALRLAIFIDDHGTNGFHTADI